jgi:hypothetical protein
MHDDALGGFLADTGQFREFGYQFFHRPGIARHGITLF